MLAPVVVLSILRVIALPYCIHAHSQSYGRWRLGNVSLMVTSDTESRGGHGEHSISRCWSLADVHASHFGVHLSGWSLSEDHCGSEWQLPQLSCGFRRIVFVVSSDRVNSS